MAKIFFVFFPFQDALMIIPVLIWGWFVCKYVMGHEPSGSQVLSEISTNTALPYSIGLYFIIFFLRLEIKKLQDFQTKHISQPGFKSMTPWTWYVRHNQLGDVHIYTSKIFTCFYNTRVQYKVLVQSSKVRQLEYSWNTALVHTDTADAVVTNASEYDYC